MCEGYTGSLYRDSEREGLRPVDEDARRRDMCTAVRHGFGHDLHGACGCAQHANAATNTYIQHPADFTVSVKSPPISHTTTHNAQRSYGPASSNYCLPT